MVTDHEWLSPTRMTGLVAYTVSLLACTWRWARLRATDTGDRVFGALAGVQLCLLLDMAFNWRWKVHDLGERMAAELNIYQLRRTPQMLALAVLAVILTLFLALIFYKFHRRIGVMLALMGTLLSVGLWCVECVSLHVVDRLLYSMVGAVMRVSLLWCGLSLVTCLGAWLNASWRPGRR